MLTKIYSDEKEGVTKESLFPSHRRMSMTSPFSEVHVLGDVSVQRLFFLVFALKMIKTERWETWAALKKSSVAFF